MTITYHTELSEMTVGSVSGQLLLSVLIPAYNEERTIRRAIEAVIMVPIHKEIIIVDDASSDDTWNILTDLAETYSEVNVFRHDQNRGKGAALRTAMSQMNGDVIVFQDADLEYNPQDFVRMMESIVSKQAQVVYGYRSLETQKPLTRFGNRLLTVVTNLLYGTQLRDMETCYKMMTRDVIERITISCNRFDIEPEITAKIAKLGYPITQFPISYTARTDKKLNPYKDGWPALVTLFRFRFRQ